MAAVTVGRSVHPKPSPHSSRGDQDVLRGQRRRFGVKEILTTLVALKASIPAEIDETGQANIVRTWLTQFGESGGASIARATRTYLSGSEIIPATKDALEAALVQLALDSYAAFLLPPDREFPMPGERHGIEVSRLLIRHPQNTAFMEAAQEDATLKKVFKQETQHGGTYGTVYRNTGSGGSLQLISLAESLLDFAWHHLDQEGMSPSSFGIAAVKGLQLVRDAFAGKQCSITARVGLMGVLMPNESTRLELPNGAVRGMTEADRKLAPESLKGQLSGTDSSGNRTTINYDGDLVLEHQFSYKVRAINRSLESSYPSEWPQDVQPSSEPDDVLLRLRFSLMLAIARESRTQIVPTWRYFDEPFNYTGRSMGWSDPRRGPGIMPITLTPEEVTAWGEWYARLDTSPTKRIELALSRVLRALAERLEPSDVLIDSVIAWENIFGTKEGEPTFRVTTCLAVLLEDSFDARSELRKKLSRIYTLRSNVVHGNSNLKQGEFPLCQEALEIAIRAIRVLTTTRTDILALPDGAARSTALLLGNSGGQGQSE